MAQTYYHLYPYIVVTSASLVYTVIEVASYLDDDGPTRPKFMIWGTPIMDTAMQPRVYRLEAYALRRHHHHHHHHAARSGGGVLGSLTMRDMA